MSEIGDLVPPVATSGSSVYPENYQYRKDFQVGDYTQPLNYDKHGYNVYTSAIRELHYTGSNTWNTSGYDYSAYANTLRREPLNHPEPTVIFNYVERNPANPYAATPINIANYAVSTGMIYVGPTTGQWGGIQVGQIAPGGYNSY